MLNRNRPDRKPPPSESTPDVYSIKAITDEIREGGIDYNDEHAPAHGGLLLGNAERIGKGARHLIGSTPVPDVASIDLPEEAGQAARLAVDADRSETELARIDAERDRQTGQVTVLESVPDHDLDPKLRKLNLLGKMLFIAGDTGVIAQPQYLAGAPWPMALLTGVAVSLTVVFTGTFVGEWGGAHLRRRRRGPAPADAEQATVDLYDDGKPHPEIGHLLLGAAGLMVLVAAAVLVMLLGDGESFGHALGAAMFAALTMAGSAALQAWTSNPAASRLRAMQAGLARTEARHARVDSRPGAAAGQQARVGELRRLIAMKAAAGEYLSLALADIRYLYPAIFTYDPYRAENGAPDAEPAVASSEAGDGPTDPQVRFARQNLDVNPNGRHA